jgi:xanthine dehydrogenase large subunit
VMNAVGQPLPHESARGHVTGEALYTDDLLRRFPGILHAWPVMAPHAHAEVVSVDFAPALDVRGVVTTITAVDLPGEGDTGPNRHDEPLFPSEVLFHSQPLAWVLAETLDSARQGAQQVRVAWRALPAVLTIEDAIAAGSFHSPPFHLQRGNATEALTQSPHQLQGDLRIDGQEHF